MSLHFPLNWTWTIWGRRRRWSANDVAKDASVLTTRRHRHSWPPAGTGRNGLTSGRNSGACALHINTARPGTLTLPRCPDKGAAPWSHHSFKTTRQRRIRTTTTRTSGWTKEHHFRKVRRSVSRALRAVHRQPWRHAIREKGGVALQRRT